MKRLLLLIPMVGLLLLSCRKDTSDLIASSIDGTWKMILVRDNATNAEMTKPASLYGDVIITFVSSNFSRGVFNGNTPTNSLGPDTYSLGSPYSISIPVLNMTKAAETSWGIHLVANLRDARQYKLETGELLVIVTSSKTLTFKKI